MIKGPTNIMAAHSGSPLVLLALLLIAGPAFVLATYSLYSRIPLAVAAVTQPLLAAASLLVGGDGVCRRMLEAPGAVEPLTALHNALAVLHSAAVAPTVQLSLGGGGQVSPLQMCYGVNVWSMLALGTLLPLALLRRWERAGRRSFAAKQQLKARAAAAGGSSDDESGDAAHAATHPSCPAHAEGPQQWLRTLPFGMPLGAAYLASCLIWHAATVAALLADAASAPAP